ncbi:MAG: branched-chain amino acid ABC transporter permease [Oscillibacter sp.]|nr:branched-chain amino acid ABC transporter permease [Oscillibacter sp.]
MTLKKKRIIFTAAVLLALLGASIALDMTLPSYHIAITVVKKATVYALVAVSMNLLNGFTGLFSLGQAGFMLLGAYAYGVLCIPVAKRAGVYRYFDGGVIQFSLPEIFAGFLGENIGTTVGMLAALLIGGILAAIMAYLVGLPVLRLKSDYLAIATLGFAEILKAFFQWNALGPITNGSNLLQSYPSFENGTSYILLAGVLIAVVVLLINSTYGRAFKAIRDDEVAAEAMGINLAKHKRLAFVISSFFAGIGGGMLAMYNGTIAAAPFKSALTYEILLIVVIGGIGSITGSVLASFLYIFSSEWLLRGLDSGTFLGINAPGLFKNGFRMAVFSVIIMVIVLFFRKGIMGDKELPDLIGRKKVKKSRKEAAGK